MNLAIAQGGLGVPRVKLLPLDVISTRRFLEALCGESDPTVIFQTYDDDLKRNDRSLARVYEGQLLEYLPALTRLNAAGASLCIQINAGGRGRDKITKLRTLFADCDEVADLPALLARCPIKPNIVTETSPGKHHLFWLLNDGEALATYSEAQKHIARALGSDPLHNLDRVLRLPGTWHRKGSPRRVQLLTCDPEPRRTIAEVIAAFPEITPEPKTKLPPLPTEPSPEPTEDAIATATRIELWLTSQNVHFERQPPDRNGTIRMRINCPRNETHKHAHVSALASGAITAGCFHQSCGSNAQRWQEFRDLIGGWILGGFVCGDHPELARALVRELRDESPEPIVAEGMTLRRYSKTSGLWEPIDQERLTKIVSGYSQKRVGERGRLKLKFNDIRNVIALATQLVVDRKFFLNAPVGVAFTNGFLQLTPAGEVVVIPYAPEHRCTQTLPFPYTPVEENPPERFLRYLAECFAPDQDAEAKGNLLQEFAGACLVGIATRFQKALILTGEGDNGKSVFVSVIRSLFPPEQTAAVAPQDLGHEYNRAQLVGVRFNAASEIPSGELFDSSSFKAVVSGDDVRARHLRHDPFTFKPRAGHVFSANTLPAVNDYSHGFWRRLLVVSWNRRFTDAERDLTLTDSILMTELPGVAAWAIEGARQLLRQNHYTAPASLRTDAERWRVETDVVAAWLSGCAEKTTVATTAADAAYQAFRFWSVENGHRQISSTTFGRRMRALGIEVKRTKHCHEYGIQLADQPLPLLVN